MQVSDDDRFSFGTKAQTLARLHGRLRHARLCDQAIVTLSEWQSDRGSVLVRLISAFGNRPLAVRSSSLHEDTANNSNAGAFLSQIGIEPSTTALGTAIDEVIGSYGDNGNGHEVLIQPMLRDIALSGVLVTRDLDTGGPYYVINYDDFSGRTDTVTSGAISKTVMVRRSNPSAIHSPRMGALIGMARELEDITGSDELDIEFCMTRSEDVFVLQVRPLAARRNWHIVPDQAIDRTVNDIRLFLTTTMQPVTGLAGSTTILGEMPDWNPAEMIGNTPRPLALSLYKKLITDGAWWEARARMGYRRVPHPLMVTLAGRPYIDVRLSFNSFLPHDLDDEVARRLIDYQLARLAAHPEYHDKVEFRVAITCRDFDFEGRARDMIDAGLDRRDVAALEAPLRRLTASALENGDATCRTLLALTDRFLKKTSTRREVPPLERARDLLTSTIPNGTIPFSILARHGFIAISFLRSLVAREALGEDEAALFLRGIRTVAADLVDDMTALASGHLSQTEFLGLYGHLRPGTYDILSWRYDERPNLYLGATHHKSEASAPFVLTDRARSRIQTCLDELGYELSPEGLLAYIAQSVAARERAKFGFTRAVSDALQALGAWGEVLGFSRDDLSFIPIESLLGPIDPGALKELASSNREAHRLTRALRLPHLVCEPDDIDVVRLARGQPTFITSISVTARAKILHANEAPRIDGCIVLIESADPGFDWIFSHGIAGLITKYGGANSHMAIRCAEFGLPAAIGCGERLFESLSKAGVIELNCAVGSARPVGH